MRLLWWEESLLQELVHPLPLHYSPFFSTPLPRDCQDEKQKTLFSNKGSSGTPFRYFPCVFSLPLHNLNTTPVDLKYRIKYKILWFTNPYCHQELNHRNIKLVEYILLKEKGSFVTDCINSHFPVLLRLNESILNLYLYYFVYSVFHLLTT